MDLSNWRNILIIRLSSLGDIILTTPLLRSLKNKFPSLEIDFLVRREYEDTLKHNPNISNLIIVERNYDNKEYRNRIAENKYDAVIDLQNNFRSRSLTFNTGSPVFRYKKPYVKRFLLVKFKVNLFNEIKSIPERYAQALQNFPLDGAGLELFLPPGLEGSISSDENYIGFCPGSKHKTKMWPKEYFIELGNLLVNNGFKVALFGGKDDSAVCGEISEKIAGSANLSNDNKLLQLAADLRSCKAVVCNDSGLMHASLALGLPVVAIFGSTVKELGFFPYKGANLVLENNSLSCRPCSHIGRNECPKGHLNCLYEITPAKAFSALHKIIR